PPGQSGFIAPDGKRSSHYSDQLDLYVNFDCAESSLTPQDVDANTSSVLVLKPIENGGPEPEPTEPEPTEPGPTEPEPTEPGPTEPEPTEPDGSEGAGSNESELSTTGVSVTIAVALAIALMLGGAAALRARRAAR